MAGLAAFNERTIGQFALAFEELFYAGKRAEMAASYTADARPMADGITPIAGCTINSGDGSMMSRRAPRHPSGAIGRWRTWMAAAAVACGLAAGDAHAAAFDSAAVQQGLAAEYACEQSTQGSAAEHTCITAAEDAQLSASNYSYFALGLYYGGAMSMAISIGLTTGLTEGSPDIAADLAESQRDLGIYYSYFSAQQQALGATDAQLIAAAVAANVSNAADLEAQLQAWEKSPPAMPGATTASPAAAPTADTAAPADATPPATTPAAVPNAEPGSVGQTGNPATMAPAADSPAVPAADADSAKPIYDALLADPPDAQALDGTGTSFVAATGDQAPALGQAEVTYALNGPAGVETDITYRIYATAAEATAYLSDDQTGTNYLFEGPDGARHFGHSDAVSQVLGTDASYLWTAQPAKHSFWIRWVAADDRLVVMATTGLSRKRVGPNDAIPDATVKSGALLLSAALSHLQLDGALGNSGTQDQTLGK